MAWDVARIAGTVATALEHSQAAGEMQRDVHARELWLKTCPELSGERYGLSGALTSRAEAEVMRIAMIYALLDCEREISEPHLRAALEVWRYCDDSVRFVFGSTTGNKTLDRILAALHEAGAAGLTRSQICDLFHRNKPQLEIENALGVLKAQERAVKRIEPGRHQSVERWTEA